MTEDDDCFIQIGSGLFRLSAIGGVSLAREPGVGSRLVVTAQGLFHPVSSIMKTSEAEAELHKATTAIASARGYFEPATRPHPADAIEELIGREQMDEMFRDALCGFVDDVPPDWAQAWAERLPDDSGADRLQEWVVQHLARDWMTGIGAIEAAEYMLVESLNNGNLRDYAREPG